MVQTGLLSSITFDDHIKEDEKKAEEEQRKQIQEKRNQLAIKCLKFLEGKKEDGYFLLETDDKINAQLLFQEIISNSEKGPLFPEEVQYVEKWLGFKHRELGQTLLAQAEAKKPAAERGKTQLAQTITMGIVAGNMVKSQQLRELKELNESVDEIAEDVEDASGGFEM